MSLSPAAILYDASGNAVGVVQDGSVFRLQVDDSVSELARDIVGADNYREGIANSQYSLAVDLDNAGGAGPYKHTLTGGLQLYAVSATLIKSQIGAEWNAIAGVVLEIDDTEATIAWLEFLSIHAEDTSTNVSSRARETFPVPIDLTVDSGALPQIATGYTETVTAVNTSTTLLDIGGNARTPAVGDLVTRVEKVSGSGTATLHVSLWYKGVA